jgi:multidrug resistance efflux pump
MLSTAFSLTFRRLSSDRGRAASWILSSALATSACWYCWAARAHVTLYEVSSSARIELDSATYPIESPLLGRVVAAHLSVGQPVREGEVLVEIDARPELLQLKEQQVRVAGIDPELGRLRAQVDAEQKARAEEQSATRLRVEEAAGRTRDAEAAAKYAEAELARIEALAHDHLVAPRELEKAQAEAHRLRAAVATLDSAARRVPQEQIMRDRERDAALERVQSQIAQLQAQRGTFEAGIARLNYEIERHRVRAPVDGRIGESATLRVGAVVQQGEKLASVIPSGRLLVAAHFPAQAAFGRLRPGQPAVLRLDGFPWTEFGTVAATTTQVAQEVRDGKVRVELAIDAKSPFRGKLEHGMPGSVEVAVERVTPLQLLLRSSGQWLTVPR